jgi:vancomycin aglycone glucosyltransferase
VRVLLSTYGSRGDVEPMVALAVQLRALGAEARVCAPPDDEFAEILARVGMPLVPFGRPLRSWLRTLPSTAQERKPRLAEVMAGWYDTLAAAAEGCDVLVATAMSLFVAGSVAEKLAIPHRHMAIFPHVLTEVNARSRNILFRTPINTHRASIGLPPVDDVREFMFTDRPWLAADPTLCPWQERADLAVVQTGAWILPDERPLPGELLAFLDAGTPPVYVGFGSVAMGESTDIAQVAIEAIRAQGRRAIVASGWAELDLIDDRDDCFTVGEVNQQALFTRVAAVIHHGGVGTTTSAARAGAPQVVIPQAADMFYWAARVADLAIGAAHDGSIPTTESLSAALRTALTPETRARATAVAGLIRTDGATVAATLLDALSRERPPASRVGVCPANADEGCGQSADKRS